MTDRRRRWPVRDGRHFLEIAERHNEMIGRTDCPVCAYVEAHLDDDFAEVEDYVFSHPDWGPQMICEAIVNCRDWAQYPDTTAEQAVADQEDFAASLSAFDYAAARRHIEPMLKRRRLVWLSRKALMTVLTYVRAGHPNPKAFLMKPEVLAHIPADVDLSGYPCPDFPDLAGLPLRGDA